MGLPDRECTVCVYRNGWPGCWASVYRGYFIVENFRFNIYYQAFPLANAIFAGIGVLLLVSILHVSLAQIVLTADIGASRRL